MDSNFKQFQAKLNLLGQVPEELAFAWVFRAPIDSEGINVQVDWPYDKERTLKALNHQKRPAASLRDVHIPILASRPDILMEVLKETDRTTVVSAIIRHVSVQHTSPVMYQEMRRIAAEKLAASANSQLPNRLNRWVSHYGKEALDAFVWSRQPKSVRRQDEQPRHFAPIDKPLYGHYVSWAVRNSGSLAEFLDAVDADTADDLVFRSRVRKYSRSNDFSLEELVDYLQNHNMTWKFEKSSELTSHLSYMLPAKFFHGIDTTLATYEALRPVISSRHHDEGVLNSFSKILVENLPNQVHSADSDLEGRYTFDTLQEYANLPSRALYNFQTDVLDEPLGVLDADIFSSVYHVAYKNAARHIASRFSYTLEATLKHVAMFGSDVPLYHVEFDPYDVVLEHFRKGKMLSFDIRRALTLAFQAKFKSHNTDQKVAEIIKLIGHQPSLAEDMHRAICEAIIKHTTAANLHSAILAGATEAILTLDNRDERLNFIEDWYTFEFSHLARNNELGSSDLSKSIAAAFQQAEPGTVQEANLRAFMNQCVTYNPWGGQANVFVRQAFSDLLDPSDVLNSIIRFFDVCGVDVNGEGHKYLIELLNCSKFFKSPEGEKFASENTEFRSFILTPYRKGAASELPKVFRKEVEQLLINNDVPVCDSRRGALHGSEVLAFVAEQFQGAPGAVWDSYFSLAQDWSGTLGELVETALVTS